MSDTETSVKIGAQTGELSAGMAGAEATVDKTAAAIQSSLARMSSSVSTSMDTMHANMRGAFSGIEAAMSKMNGMFGMVAGALAGGAAFKAVISETVNWTGEAVKLSKQLGITVQEASLYNTALGNVFLSTETLTTAASMLTRTLKNKEDAFTALGVATRDQNGHYRSTMDIMTDVNAKLLTLKEGTDRNTAGMSVYGRAWLEVMGVLKLNTKVMEDARQELSDYNKEVNPEKQAEVKKYKEAMENVGDVFEGVKLMLGNALLPALTQLGEFLGNIGPAVCTAMSGAVRGLLTFFEGLAMGGVIALNLLAAALNSVLLSVWNLSGALMKLVSGDFKGAWETLKTGGEQIKQQWVDAFSTIESYGTGAGKRIKEMWGFGAPKVSAPAATPDGRFDGGGETGATSKKDTAEKSRLSEWKSELEQMKETEENFFKDSKTSDMAFWQDKLKLTRKGSEEERQIRHEIFQLKSAIAREELATELTNLKTQSDAALQGSQKRIDIAKQEAELIKSKYGEQSKEYAAMLREIDRLEKEHHADQLKRADMQLDKEQEISLISISMERDRLAHLKNLGAISDQQEIAALTQITQREQAIEVNALQQKLLRARQGSIEEQQLMNQLEVAQTKHGQNMQKLNLQAASASASAWKTVFSTITQSFSQAINNMIMYGNKFGTTMKNLARSILGNFINMIVKMAMEWISKQIMMTVFGTAQEQARVAAKAAAAAEAQAITSVSNVAEATSETAVASIGAASAVASIPFIGPALAAAAAASMSAMGAGYIAMAAAEGGYDIPAGVNPVTQLHQNEMVLPANLADKVRNMTDGAGSGPGAQVTFNVHALDAKSVKQFFNKHGGKIADTIHGQMRNFKTVRA